jgi:hypothetical protein
MVRENSDMNLAVLAFDPDDHAHTAPDLLQSIATTRALLDRLESLVKELA